MSNISQNITDFRKELEISMQKTKQLVEEKRFDEIPIKQDKSNNQFTCQKIQDVNPFIKNIQSVTPIYEQKVQFQALPENDAFQDLIMQQCYNCKAFETQQKEHLYKIKQLEEHIKQIQFQMSQTYNENKMLNENSVQKKIEFERSLSGMQQKILILEQNLKNHQAQVVVSPQHLQKIQELSEKLLQKKQIQEKQCKKIKHLENELNDFKQQRDKQEAFKEEIDKQKKLLLAQDQNLINKKKNYESQIKELQNQLTLQFNKHSQNQKESNDNKTEQKIIEAQIDQELITLKNDNILKDQKLKSLKAKQVDLKSKIEFECSNTKQRIDQLVQESIQNRELIANLQGENNSLQEKVIFQDSELQELRVLRNKTDQTELIHQIKEELKEKKNEYDNLREKYENFLQQSYSRINQEQIKQINQAPIYIEKERPIYIDKPVYIEKIIEKEVPKIQEKIVEKIVYVDKFIEVPPQYIEKLVDKPVYIEVEKPVYIEKEQRGDEEIYLKKIQDLVNQNKQKIEEVKNLRLRINELETQLKYNIENQVLTATFNNQSQNIIQQTNQQNNINKENFSSDFNKFSFMQPNVMFADISQKNSVQKLPSPNTKSTQQLQNYQSFQNNFQPPNIQLQSHMKNDRQNKLRSISPVEPIQVPLFQPQNYYNNQAPFSIDQIKNEMNQIKNQVIRQTKFVNIQ